MDGMDWMASAMRAAQAQLETAARNLANASSDGYRRERFTLLMTARGLVPQTRVDPAQGGIRTTGRNLDLALVGPGAFRTTAGITRDGSFARDRDGFLADRAGHRVLDAAGAPLRIAPDAAVRPDGTIEGAAGITGRIPLPAGTTLRGGALESSSVDAIGETLAVLTAQRAFETAQRTLVAIDQTREKTVNDVGRLK